MQVWLSRPNLFVLEFEPGCAIKGRSIVRASLESFFDLREKLAEG
jgi:hypothetical protein